LDRADQRQQNNGGDLVPNISAILQPAFMLPQNTQDVTVANNTIQRVAHSGIRPREQHSKLRDWEQAYLDWDWSIISFGGSNTTDSKIFDNIVAIDPNSPLGTSTIQEKGASRK